MPRYEGRTSRIPVNRGFQPTRWVTLYFQLESKFKKDTCLAGDDAVLAGVGGVVAVAVLLPRLVLVGAGGDLIPRQFRQGL